MITAIYMPDRDVDSSSSGIDLSGKDEINDMLRVEGKMALKNGLN